jgi:anti-anti-sigma factor
VAVKVARDPGRAELVVSGEIDMACVAEFLDAVRSMHGDGPVCLRMTDVSFMDSSGLHALLTLAHENGPVHLLSPTPLVRRVIAILGVGPDAGIFVEGL